MHDFIHAPPHQGVGRHQVMDKLGIAYDHGDLVIDLMGINTDEFESRLQFFAAGIGALSGD